MDEFRELQKKECPNGGGQHGKHLPYGCGCCRKHRSLNKHKKWIRRLSRVHLKEKDKKNFKNETLH